MSNFFLQLGAEGITVLMYVAAIALGVFGGMALRKAKNKQTTR